MELTVKDRRGKESKEQTKVTVKQDPQTGEFHEEEKVLLFNTLVKEIWLLLIKQMFIRLMLQIQKK